MTSIKNTFPAAFFAANRSRLREVVQTDGHDVPIVVSANGLLQRNGDNTFQFAQDSNFWYLTGIELPDILLVIEETGEYLIVPGRGTSREAFDGAIDVVALTGRSGIANVLDEAAGWQRLEQSALRTQKLATPGAMAPYLDAYGMYANPARRRLAWRLRRAISDVELVDIRQQLATMRMRKQPKELMALQQAIDITIDSLELLTETTRFAGYHNEYEIEADLSREFRFRGAAGHAFAPIIAGGRRAVTLHNVSNEAPLRKNCLVVLDVGAEIDHYAADITRTRAYGHPTVRQQAVFAAVLDVQSYALSLLRPSTMLKEYEQAVEVYMGKALQQLKLLSASELDREHIRRYFPHATSHFLGLDVHDGGDYGRPLEAGVVLTCEPGIYIPEEGIGVRIEDDVLITGEGTRVLSDRLPKTLD